MECGISISDKHCYGGLFIKDIVLCGKSIKTSTTNMSNIKSSTDSDNSNEVYNINNNNNRNNIVNNSNGIDSENRNYNISDSENRNFDTSDSENNSIVTINIVNRSISENRVNISNFLNNEWETIYVPWYRLYNFLLGGRDTDIIDLNYKKE